MANVFYGQSGGATAVINASAAGVISRARQKNQAIGTVYAGENGILGALNERLYDTSYESDTAIDALRYTPGCAFGSCRFQLPAFNDHPSQYHRLFDVFKAHNIRYFIYNGGGDSQDTTLKIAEASQQVGYDLACVGIPKTIDNDLPFTDSAPGFGSVAKYIAIATQECALDLQSMANSSTQVFILEVMGRHAGWIAAASGIGKTDPACPPHIILFPERPFEQDAFLSQVRYSVQQYGYCVIVCSEGIVDRQKVPITQCTADRDAFGHRKMGGVAASLAQMIQHQLGYKYHYAIADYLQRSAAHIASKTDVDQAYALGQAAVDKAIQHGPPIMLTIERLSTHPYRWQIGSAALDQVAKVERQLPQSFISANGFEITAECRDYLTPLIEGEHYPPYENGLIAYRTLKKTLIPQKLSTHTASTESSIL